MSLIDFEISISGQVVPCDVSTMGSEMSRIASADSNEDRESIVHKWAIKDLQSLHRRRHLLRKSGLELFFANGTSRLLVVRPELRPCVYECVVKNKLFKRQVVHGARLLSEERAMKTAIDAQSRWLNGESTNFEYLCALNSISGRTHDDLAQYPVFPWIRSDCSSPKLDLTNPAVFRQLRRRDRSS